jgi:hypothetical protein
MFQSVAFTQNVQFSASAKTSLQEGENFYLKYQVNQKGKNLKIPDFGKFQVLTGPSQSTSSNTQIINGHVTHSSSYTYTYVLKAPSEIGKYNIPAAKITVDKKEYSSNALNIRVVKAGTTTQNQQTNQRYSNRQSQPTASGKGFVRLNLNKTEAYLGEPIYGVLKLYTPNRNLAGFEKIEFPNFNGFWAEDYKVTEQIHLQQEAYNGKTYYSAELKSFILYPQQTGELKIESGNYGIIVQERVSGNGNSPFDSFFGSYQNVTQNLTNNIATLNIKPLPKNKPNGFNGGIGSYNISSKISHDSIDVNEAFTLEIKISGTGNLNLIKTPEINFPKEFEVYDPEISKNFSQTINGSNGSQTYTYTIIPRYPDTYILPKIDISWFDTKTKSYKSYKSPKQSIFVRRTADFKDENPTAREFSSSQIDVIGKDIRYIKEVNLKKNDKFVGSFLFFLAYIIPLLIFSLIIFLRRKQIKERANVAKIRDKKANKIAMKRLKSAKILMNTGNEEFYTEVIKALWGYVGDKLDMDTANLSRESVSEGLAERNLNPDLTDKLLNIIDLCEYSHFAPADKENDPKKIYKYAASLILKLEQNL